MCVCDRVIIVFSFLFCFCVRKYHGMSLISLFSSVRLSKVCGISVMNKCGKTRMHSSRMCTARSSSHLGGGGSPHTLPRSRHPSGSRHPGSRHLPRSRPPQEQTPRSRSPEQAPPGSRHPSCEQND